MESFSQLDYLGDAALRLLALRKNPNKPSQWAIKYASNNFLSKLFDSVYGPNSAVPLPKSDGYAKPSKRSKLTHLKASHVESWVGEAYLKGGVDEVEMVWDRLVALYSGNRNVIMK